MPAIEAAGEAKIVFVLPIPRYVTKPCCADPNHLQNRKEADYLDIIAATGPAVRTAVEEETDKRRWNAVIFDPMTSFSQEASLADMISSAGISISTVADGVHLTNAAYKDILNNLRQTKAATASMTASS